MKDERLFATVRRGIEAERMADGATGAEKERIDALVAEGNAATEALFKKNMPLVHHIAKRYVVFDGLREDFIQEGYLALLLSIKTGGFDPKRGSFSTYAGHMIEWAFSNFLYLHLGSRVSASPFVRKEASKALVRLEEFEEENPSASEADKAAFLGINVQTLESYRVALTKSVPLQTTPADPDSEMGDLVDELGEPDEYPELDEMDNDLLNVDLRLCMNQLSARQRRVMTSLFGLDGQEAKTLDEVSKEISVSVETVRKDRDKALAILSSPENKAMLKVYL